MTHTAQLWHFISTLLSQHLALIHPNNYWRHFWDDWFFTSERHLFWYANSNKWERGLHKYRKKLNAKINVTFQRIMAERIINILFSVKRLILPTTHLFVIKNLNTTLSALLEAQIDLFVIPTAVIARGSNIWICPCTSEKPQESKLIFQKLSREYMAN